MEFIKTQELRLKGLVLLITEQLDRKYLSRTKPQVVQSILDRYFHPAHMADKRTKPDCAHMGHLYCKRAGIDID